MGILNWFKVKPGKSKVARNEAMNKTSFLEHDSILDLKKAPEGIKEEIHLYETEEELKAAIRKITRFTDWMITGVRFVRCETREERFLYEIYRANSQDIALRFLRSSPLDSFPPLYYVIVETNAGNLGKDKEGIFDEATGEEII